MVEKEKTVHETGSEEWVPIVQLDSVEAMVVVMLFVLQLVQHMNLQHDCEC